MRGRTTTNILLAIIAGVLLFGQSAMTGALQVGAIGFAVVLILGLLWAGFLSLIGWMASEWESAKANDERLATIAFFVLAPFGLAFGLSVAWAWLQGAERPFDVAFASPFGIAWTYALGAGLFVGAVVVVWQLGRRLIRDRAQVPSRIANAGIYYLVGLVAVVALPVREWRSRRALGLNVFWAAGNAFIVMLVGFMISLATIGFSLLVGAVLVGAIPLATIMQ